MNRSSRSSLLHPSTSQLFVFSLTLKCRNVVNGRVNAKYKASQEALVFLALCWQDIILLSPDLKWQHVTFILMIASVWGFFGQESGVWLQHSWFFQLFHFTLDGYDTLNHAGTFLSPCRWWNSVTLCQLCVATLPAAPPQRWLPSH